MAVPSRPSAYWMPKEASQNLARLTITWRPSMGELHSLMQAAQARADSEGYSSKGTSRELVAQTLLMCDPDHPKWRLAGDAAAPVKCGVCHAPAPSLEVVWL